ncbi:MAG: hypothetical protein WD355_02915 [Balneolaceae bacterium]
MKTRIQIIAFLLVAMTAVTPLFAQRSVQSVMTVSAEVVSGTHIKENMRTDIAEQLHRAGMQENGKTIEIGSYSITAPESVEYIASSESSLQMMSSSHSFELEITAEQEYRENGDERTYHFKGVVAGDEILAGHYQGEATTVIEYE